MAWYEIGLSSGFVLPKGLEGSLQRTRRRRPGKFHGPGETKAKDADAAGAGTGLRCTDFGWDISWVVPEGSAHMGRASLAFLEGHPEETNAIHVVM